MKIKIGGETKDYRSIWMEDGIIRMIDQTLVPYEFKIHDCGDYQKVAEAIKTMVIRGAPAIGAAGCYGMAIAVLKKEDLKKAAQVLRATRPTAYDLFDAIDFFEKKFKENTDPVRIANDYADASAERCRKIGEVGEKLINDGARILTHCN
ncbi:MAG: S-methyl-5-thioribose-1-phosphate isomerase, partial [Candidatus Altiarchaeota archaeon]|nr:S-methyl-5-thioribose-1-phosphate isomerase [Candidatus Altiarchaeota archaeon]